MREIVCLHDLPRDGITFVLILAVQVNSRRRSVNQYIFPAYINLTEVAPIVIRIQATLLLQPIRISRLLRLLLLTFLID